MVGKGPTCRLRYRNSSNEGSNQLVASSIVGKLPLPIQEVVSNVPPSFPLHPRAVLLHYAKFLLDYERTEILDYDTIYYIDTKHPKLLGASPKGCENHGFDNQGNEYICEVGDHI